MNEFLRLVFSELGSGIWLAMLLVALVGGGVLLRQRRRGGGPEWKRVLLLLLLVGYLAVVGFVTILRPGIGFGGFNLHLFRAWKEAWNNFSLKNWANVILNILMFVPMGVLVPLVFEKCRGRRILLVALGSTLLVECLQLATGTGIFDVDDLFANALGCLMGYCLMMAVLSGLGQKWRGAAVYFLLSMLPMAAVGAIFIAYAIKPYGNLPYNWIYRTNTQDVSWSLDCTLPEPLPTAAVYQAPSRTQAECDKYALEFAAHWGGTYDDIYYYDQEIYYRDYDTDGRMTYLTLSRLDGSFSFWSETNTKATDAPTVWAELSRPALEEALAQFGITIPKEAVFLGVSEALPGDGDRRTHVYRAEGLVTADGFLNGECRVCLSEDGTCLEVDHRLVTYAHYADEAIRSPEEACRKMFDGYFSAGWFERQNPTQVHVTDCQLAYALDTKGFYQPVYQFEVMAPDWDGSDIITIPAIAF